MIHELFPIGIYQKKINVEESVEFIKGLDYNRVYEDNGYISKHKNVLDMPELYSLRKDIEIALIAYSIELKLKDVRLEIQNSWVMKHIEGDYSPVHHHKNSVISGIVYIEVNEESGEISFYNNNTTLFHSTLEPEFWEYNKLNSSSFNIKPETGDILIFPSHLQHSVGRNDINKERYALAFNVFPRGKLGGGAEKISELIL